ncbi:hypothetical protein [Deferrisoma camini]|uniref:hypothetical protein n=1 Tax=Deferrisoma camini TaxID=1035120 RepID=UPI00146AE1F7|nr:hypothetical protein [Deferrisoma camini]
MAGVRYTTLMSLKDLEHEPSSLVALGIARAAGRSVAWLLGKEECEPTPAERQILSVGEAPHPYGYELDERERQVLRIYRSLTEEGQELALDLLQSVAKREHKDSGSARAVGGEGGRVSARSRTQSSG